MCRRRVAFARPTSLGLRCCAVTRTRPFARPPEMRNAKEALEKLSRPGPHQVLRGNLGMGGSPGVVFAPEEGRGPPALAFGHARRQQAERYSDLPRHLASWGIGASSRSNHRGPLPIH